MSSIGEKLRTAVRSSTAIAAIVGTRVHQNRVPKSSTWPRIWFGRRGAEFPGVCMTTTGNTAGEPLKTIFDLEVASNDIDQAIDLGLMTQKYLNCYAKSTDNITAIFADDHDDEYIPKGIGEDDEGIHVSALELTILHTST